MKIEVNSRTVVFTRTRVGEKCQHAIQYPSRGQADQILLFSNKPESVYIVDEYNQRSNGKKYVMGLAINHIPIFTEFAN